MTLYQYLLVITQLIFILELGHKWDNCNFILKDLSNFLMLRLSRMYDILPINIHTKASPSTINLKYPATINT